DSGCLNLYLLQVFKRGILTGAPIDGATGGDPVDQESVLCAAGAIDLNAALDLSHIDSGREDGQRLECAASRKQFELILGNLEYHGRVLRIDLRSHARDLNGGGQGA